MTELRRHALYELRVTVLTAVTVAVIYLFTRQVMPSMAGFALLALLGVKALPRRGRSPGPVLDERDEAIHRQAAITAYTLLWLALVLWGVVVPLRFGEAGSVPIAWVAPVVWVSWWWVTGVRAVATLVLDQRGV